MANHLRGEITISLGDVTYDCKLNFDSLVRIEKALNISIIQLANKISQADLKLTDINFIIYTAIKGGGKDITEKVHKAHGKKQKKPTYKRIPVIPYDPKTEVNE